MAPTSPPRPWSADTDWAQGDALRFLYMLRLKSETLPLEGDWVLCTMVEWTYYGQPRSQTPPTPWGYAAAPIAQRRHDGCVILGFADGSGLVLRQHPRQYGMLALPALPFVGVADLADPRSFWAPCLDMGHHQHATGRMADDERLFPFFLSPGFDTMNRAFLPLVEAAANFQGLFPNLRLPHNLFLFSGCRTDGPFYTHPDLDKHPEWRPMFDLMTRMARRVLPERLAYQQLWGDFPATQDPRVPKRIAAHMTTGTVFASQHERMAVLARLFSDDAAPEGHPA